MHPKSEGVDRVCALIGGPPTRAWLATDTEALLDQSASQTTDTAPMASKL